MSDSLTSFTKKPYITNALMDISRFLYYYPRDQILFVGLFNFCFPFSKL